MVAKAEYTLEIYKPDSADDVYYSMRSPVPFMSISKGQLIHPATWLGIRTPSNLLEVTNVEHLIWESEDTLNHKICVYTIDVDDTRSFRINGY